MSECRICGGICVNRYELRGTMYGVTGRYWYTICDKCGCLQIEEIPNDLANYYSGASYYSFNSDKRSLKNKLLFFQIKNQVKKWNFLGALVQFLYPVDYSCFKLIEEESSILDVGCGDGELLRWLHELGFRHLEGIDPYAEECSNDNYNIISKDIRDYDTSKKYDMITMYHVMEHLDDPNAIIDKAVGLLKDNGYIVIMVPFFSKYYWQKYGDTLYTLDPPRHLYIHTKESISELFKHREMSLIYFNTELDPGIPEMSKNIKNGHTEKNNGSTFIRSAIVSLSSKCLRRKLKENEDGAIATFIFQKI